MAEIINDILIKTDNFGVIWRKDYENPRFGFLKRDKGVPVIQKKFIKKIDGEILDKYGNKRKGKIDKEYFDTVVAPEYFEWQTLHKNRIYAQSKEGEAFKNIDEEFLSRKDLCAKSWDNV